MGKNTANISSLKAKLSHYLRGVKKGEELIITDGNLPIAKIVPLPSPGSNLQIREPEMTYGELLESGFKVSKVKNQEKINTAELLKLEREDR